MFFTKKGGTLAIFMFYWRQLSPIVHEYGHDYMITAQRSNYNIRPLGSNHVFSHKYWNFEYTKDVTLKVGGPRSCNSGDLFSVKSTSSDIVYIMF